MGLFNSKEFFQSGPQDVGNPPIQCPPGTYGDTTGLTESKCSGLCSAGYYCTAGSTSPTQNLCPAGRFCLAGTGDPLSANPPGLCPAGTSSSTGSSVCTACNDGDSSLSGGLCLPCAFNSYSVNTCRQGSSRASTPANVTTVAGTPGEGVAGVNGFDAASFIYAPMGIVVDSCGSIFVTDSSHTIRKIFIRKGSPTVTLATTFAGSGVPGFLDTSGQTVAQFSSPQGLAIDPDNNLYVADANNHAIRKITPLGVVTTIAGNGYAGYNDGIGRSAIFNTPTGLVLDSRGNIFVADKNNSLIRKIAPDGAVTTIAGSVGTTGSTDAIGTLARFRNPSGLAIDSGGILYVADTDNNLIRRIAPNGAVTTIAGRVGPALFTNGGGSCGRFNSPTSITIDTNGTLYVSDRFNNAIRQITITSGTPRTGCGTTNPGIATVTTLAGSGTPGFVAGVGGSAQFNTPHGIFIDPVGNLYVADTMNSSIRMITLSTPRLPPPTTCVTLCTSCCSGLQANSGSTFCSPYPGYAMNTSGAVVGVSRGLTTNILHPFYTGAISANTWTSAFGAAFTATYDISLTTTLAYNTVQITGATLHMFPGWVAFGYINRSPLTKMELDMTPYTGSTILRTNTYALMVFSESEISYTRVKPYSDPSSTSFVNAPTLSYRRSGVGPLISTPLPQVICGDSSTTC